MDNFPLVSVIIPTKNSERTIKTCLQSIESQSYPKIEIIIVDQESEDNTLEICKQFKVKIINVPASEVYTPPTKSRNRGAQESKGKYLVHVDSDMELTTTVIKEAVELCENNNYGAIVIHDVDIVNGFWGKCKALERKCYVGDKEIEGARFVKKQIFDQIGGYDENINAGEDWDIHERYKQLNQIGSIESLIKHHQRKVKLIKQIRKKYNYAKSFSAYIKKHPRLAKNQLTIFRHAYFRNWKLFLKDPIHAVGFIILKVLEFSAAGFGLLRK